VHCLVRDPITGEMYSRPPAGSRRRAELHLTQTDIADTSWGPECELHIFASIRFDQNQHEGYYQIDSVAGSPQQSDSSPPRSRLEPSQD
jgi:glutamine synthetase